MLEESEVDPLGKVMRCTTKNLDHVKVMRVEEHIHIRQTEEGYAMYRSRATKEWSADVILCSKTLQTTEAMFLSGFGWGLTKRIENYGLAKFKTNLQRVCLTIPFPVQQRYLLAGTQSREGFFFILDLIRQSRMQPMTMGAPSSFLLSHRSHSVAEPKAPAHHEVSGNHSGREEAPQAAAPARTGIWSRWKSWLRSG